MHGTNVKKVYSLIKICNFGVYNSKHVRMDSYKKRNESLQNAKTESHVLPSGEIFVLSSVLIP